MNTSNRVAIYSHNCATDHGFSGRSTDRPYLKDLLLKAKEHTFDEVKVLRLNRLSRNVNDLAKITSVVDNIEEVAQSE